MRSVTILAIGALALSGVAPASAMAATPDEQAAAEACGTAIRGEVRDQFPQAYNVQFVSRDTQAQGRVEMSVVGKGEFDDRNGGRARFDYGCTYNLRTGSAYALDLQNVRPIAEGKKDNSAAIAGLVLGAVVLGALVAASDHNKDHDRDHDRDHRDDSWSPADGVRCSARDRSCYKDGHYSEKWTRRVFY